MVPGAGRYVDGSGTVPRLSAGYDKTGKGRTPRRHPAVQRTAECRGLKKRHARRSKVRRAQRRRTNKPQNNKPQSDQRLGHVVT
ncbi:hypothetical protein GCM10022255_016930 [Dactylosporangium darangshiense]|uniref:Transposase n=1 Tax=Dactylosporangium darangshiense TaxID=579108 RepID=A0ABP8D2T8_9ACTN